jgi:hypothetical protein
VTSTLSYGVCEVETNRGAIMDLAIAVRHVLGIQCSHSCIVPTWI